MGKGMSAPAKFDEAKYKAECDARTLAEAAAIKGDKKRMGAAGKAAKSMIAEKRDELKGLQAVAGKKAGDLPAARKGG